MNLKGFSSPRDLTLDPPLIPIKENSDFMELLEVINIFEDNMRKPYKTALLNSRSLAEFINPTVKYSAFQKGFFESIGFLTNHDSNNLKLIRAIVDQQYEILLRLFNETANFISQKLNLHYNSQRYFAIKTLLFYASLANPYFQMNSDTLSFLKDEIPNEDSIKNIIGFDYSFFSLLCANECGNYDEIIQYLVKKDERYVGLASLRFSFYLPFVAESFDEPDPDNKGYALFLTYAVLSIFNVFFQANKKDLLEFKSMKALTKYLQENIGSISSYYWELRTNSRKVNWFSIEPIDVWNEVNCMISDFIEKDVEVDNDKKILYEEIRGLFSDDVLKIIESLNDYIQINWLLINKPEARLASPLFNFFPMLFYGASGLSQNDSMEPVLLDIFDKDIKVLDDFLIGFLQIDEQNEKKDERKENQKKFYSTILKFTIIGLEIVEKMKSGKISVGPDYALEAINSVSQTKDNFVQMMLEVVTDILLAEKSKDVDINEIFSSLITKYFMKIVQGKKEFEVEHLEEEIEIEKKKFMDENQIHELSEKDLKKIFRVMDEDKINRNFQVHIKELFGENGLQPLIHLIFEIEEYFEQASSASSEIKKQQLQNIALKLGEFIFYSNEKGRALFESIYCLVNHDFDKLGPVILDFFNIDKKKLKLIKALLEDLRTIMQAPQAYVNNKITYLTSTLTGQKASSLDIINDKLGMEKDMSPQDLFQVFDSDKSGKISLEEFKLLTKRLNMNLSDHRIIEIFTSVKGEEIKNSQELNEKEFAQALNYLQEKSIMLTLEYLGITKEILLALLIWLVVLLLILFAFIFVGITAFAIGGTFGSIINSMFPIGLFF